MSDVPGTPAEFFTEYLPSQFQESLGDTAESGPGAICFEVIDEGQWSLWIDGGKIQTQDGRHDDTLVQVSIPKDDWADAVKRIASGGIGPVGGGGASMLTNPAAATTLKAAQGTLKFVIKEGDADHWMGITFGGADPNVDAPRATLTMTQEVAEQLGAGNVNPQELFMAGKIQIAGDMMMLMQLAPIMS